MNNLNWDDVRFFLAVARSGRLTLAARTLRVDHATCSRRIASLETALAAKLFVRRPQGYSLTEQGEKLLGLAEAMESQAFAAQSEVGGRGIAVSGIVRVGAPDGFSTFFLAPRVGRLMEKFPELEIQLVASPRLPSLSKREADVVISLNRPNEGKVVARKLTDYDLGLFAARAYVKSAPLLRVATDLADHPIIGYIDDLIFTPELDYLDEICKGLRARLQSSNLIAQMQATVAGAGLCVLPHFMTRNERTLVAVLPDIVSLRRSFWLTVHEDLRHLARVRVLLDFLAHEIRLARELFLAPAEPRS